MNFLRTSKQIRIRYFLPALVSSLLLAGCNDLVQAPKDAAKLDADLHAAMTRQDWHGIYTESDDLFKQDTSEQKFTALLTAVSKKLGAPVSTVQGGWNLNTNNSGMFLKTECETKFSNNASGTEEITWRKSDGKYRLYGYHINSEELIER